MWMDIQPANQPDRAITVYLRMMLTRKNTQSDTLNDFRPELEENRLTSLLFAFVKAEKRPFISISSNQTLSL